MKFSHFSAIVTVTTSALVHAAPSSKVRRGADDPVCIVGAGPAGLTAGATVQAHGRKAVIFEKKDVVGGKCQSYYNEQGQYHPLGALLFSNGTYVETVKVVEQMGVPAVAISPQRGAGKDWDYDYKSKDGGIVPAKVSLNFLEQGFLNAEVIRYNWLWNTYFKKYAVVGFKNGVPPEFQVSTKEWMDHHWFKALQIVVIKGMFMYGYGDLREIPIAYILQYFTPDIMTFFSNQHTGYLIDYHAVWDKYSKSKLLDKVPINLGAQIQQIDRTGEFPVIQWTDSKGQQQTQGCSSLVMAFPPTQSNLQAAGLTLSAEERDLFSKVVIENYYSGAVRVKTPKNMAFTAKQNSDYTPPDAAGEPVLSIRLFENSDISTVYSWDGKGSQERMTTLDSAQQFTMNCLSLFNKDPTDKTSKAVQIKDDDVKAFRRHDYFPHVSPKDIGTFYTNFNDIQGKQKTHYASGLNMFEMVEFAILAGKDVVENYILKEN